jgi:uncharacterized protein YyaL (SSP411 family)
MKHTVFCRIVLALPLALAACTGKPNPDQPNLNVSTNATSASHTRTNRLAREKSPYLLQHARNPVDWYPWGEEAFARARAENKPIFLSIGYSTCHWCHVMERESFESEAVAQFLNEHFVSIKVDREERPDVDKIYMTFVQGTAGSGGWPLNVFLTPELKPFFGGTYFPPENRHGRGSFLSVLQQILKVWQERHGEVTSSADEIHAHLEAAAASASPTNSLLTANVLRRAGASFKDSYDPRHGGFGGAPKFPQPSQPSFLLRYAKRFKDDEAARMVLHTCEAMAAGGIRDQLGGGFARYSVDAEWLVPHFEKMLYDNAQLVNLYLDAHLAANSGGRNPKSEAYADVARDILAYVLREMTHPEGGFFSAEDADSEGHEGKFYCWTLTELSGLLSPEEFNVTIRCFGITEKGNFVDHSHPQPLAGQNVLSLVDPKLAGDDASLLASAKKKMFEARTKRIRPHLDDKILASWNGLMLGAMARAYAVLGDANYRAAAEKNLVFLRQKLWASARSSNSGFALPNTPALFPGERENTPQSLDTGQAADGHAPPRTKLDERRLFPSHEPALDSRRGNEADSIASQGVPPPQVGGYGSGVQSANLGLGNSLPAGVGQGEGKKDVGTLYHRWRDGERDNVQLLEAYAFLLDGVIHLYEATLDPAHLEFAIELAEAMIRRFYDAENGGFWQSAADSSDLIVRMKDDYDGAEPSGNSVATLALLKLAAITDRQDFRQPAEATLRFFAARLERIPRAVPCMLQALDFWLEEPRRVVVAGDPQSARTPELLLAAHSVYQPNKVVLGNLGPVEEFSKALPAKDGPVVYLCTGKACQPPTSEAVKVIEMLR